MPIFQYGKCTSDVTVGNEEILRAYRNGKIVYEQGDSATTYGLQFTGTQRISTHVLGSSNLRVVVDVIQNTVSADTPLFGSRVGMADRTWCYWQQVSSQVRTDYNNASYQLARSNAPFNQRLIIDKDKNVTKVNGTVIHTAPAASFTNPVYLFLGNVGTAVQHANNFNGTMFSCQVYDNDVLERDFVPIPQGQRPDGGDGIDAPVNFVHTQKDGQNNTFRWNAVNGAASYQIQRNSDLTFTTFQDLATQPGTATTITTDFSALSEYRIRLRAVVGGVFSEWTELLAFMRDAPNFSVSFTDTGKQPLMPAPSNCLWDKVTKNYFINAGTTGVGFGIVEV